MRKLKSSRLARLLNRRQRSRKRVYFFSSHWRYCRPEKPSKNTVSLLLEFRQAFLQCLTGLSYWLVPDEPDLMNREDTWKTKYCKFNFGENNARKRREERILSAWPQSLSIWEDVSRPFARMRGPFTIPSLPIANFDRINSEWVS